MALYLHVLCLRCRYFPPCGHAGIPGDEPMPAILVHPGQAYPVLHASGDIDDTVLHDTLEHPDDCYAWSFRGREELHCKDEATAQAAFAGRLFLDAEGTAVAFDHAGDTGAGTVQGVDVSRDASGRFVRRWTNGDLLHRILAPAGSALDSAATKDLAAELARAVNDGLPAGSAGSIGADAADVLLQEITAQAGQLTTVPFAHVRELAAKKCASITLSLAGRHATTTVAGATGTSAALINGSYYRTTDPELNGRAQFRQLGGADVWLWGTEGGGWAISAKQGKGSQDPAGFHCWTAEAKGETPPASGAWTVNRAAGAKPQETKLTVSSHGPVPLLTVSEHAALPIKEHCAVRIKPSTAAK